MTVLDDICARKREHIAAMQAQTPLGALKDRIGAASKPRGFRQRLLDVAATGRPALITEIKKASPSGGLIRPDFDPAALARTLESAGAACLSVLTDGPYFQGRDEDLIAARAACALPVLRKDFMLDEYQIHESRALGADCVLLIMAALDDAAARRLYDCARGLDLDVLVEVHDRPELDRAIALGADMIGVNNRNLKTLVTDLNTAQTLAAHIPDTVLKIAESGISTAADLQKLQSAGYTGFLIGESVMRQDDVARAIADLVKGKKNFSPQSHEGHEDHEE